MLLLSDLPVLARLAPHAFSFRKIETENSWRSLFIDLVPGEGLQKQINIITQNLTSKTGHSPALISLRIIHLKVLLMRLCLGKQGFR